LTPDFVANIHSRGGTILGSSRGLVEAAVIVDALERMNINVLFAVGGDGTQRGALAVCKEINQRGLKIAVVGIPKTIDNDVSHVDKTFGYETAFSIAGQAVNCAHVEAGGAYNGIGLVKLMGRDSGFIAASAAIATHDVNFVLVPEVPFHLQGENGFLRHLRERLHRRHHAVICVAEGAGQDLMASDAKPQVCDASGNVKHADIGIFLSEAIKSDLQSHGVEFTLKYIDPSYMIRSAPAIPSDAVYCSALGQNAVHAAMAGKTAMIVGHWNDAFTHVPIEAAIAERKKIDPESMFWLQVLESTGQPLSMLNS
jgi:6-phosphofructokinase 1